MSEKFVKHWLILLLMITVRSVISASQLTIQVKPVCEVEGQIVTLSDIATIQGENKQFAENLKKATICSAPLPGKIRELTRAQIITALRRSYVLDDSIVFLCPELISVKRRASIVTGDMLIDTVRKHVSARNDQRGIVSVEVIRTPPEQEVPTGKIELRVKELNRQLKGRVNVPVEIVVDDKVYRTVYVSVLIKVIARVPVTTKAIAKDEELGASNISLEERDITNLPSDIIIGELEAGLSARIPIPQGSVLRQGWVSSPPVIKSGDSVIVVVNNGAVTVSDKGIAVQDGHIGERIKVRLFGESREVHGIVSAAGIVEISLDRRT
ncbi:MAG: flagellar basal body P-ring formation chaperone FlgA [Armatimonadota bacterium]|nr:flagellar basal body P-ring formation chaperone FlgA [Armatimonadota bacterium]